MKRRYYVTTWDSNKEAFTPQRGVRKGPYSLFGLRKALRALRTMGYSAHRHDPSVYVESPEAWQEMCERIENYNKRPRRSRRPAGKVCS